MRDFLHDALKWIDHNRYLLAALALTVVMAGYAGGCASTTTGLDGQSQVTRPQLRQQLLDHQQQLKQQQAKIEAEKQAAIAQAQQAQAALSAQADALGLQTDQLTEQFQARIDDLNQQDALKKQVFDKIGGMLTQLAAGTVNPANGITGALAVGSLLFGVGAAADKRRADQVISQAKTAKK